MTILDRLQAQVMARALRYSTALSTTMDAIAGDAITEVVRKRKNARALATGNLKALDTRRFDDIHGVYPLEPEPAGTAGNPLPGDKET